MELWYSIKLFRMPSFSSYSLFFFFSLALPLFTLMQFEYYCRPVPVRQFICIAIVHVVNEGGLLLNESFGSSHVYHDLHLWAFYI